MVTVIAGGYAVVLFVGLVAGVRGNVVAAAPLIGAITSYWRRSSTEWYESRRPGAEVPAVTPSTGWPRAAP